MKNNKTILSLLLIAALIIAVASCNKSFLDKKPISQETTGNFYKTASDAEAGLAGAYSALQIEFYIWDFETNGDGRTDNCYAGGNNADNFAIENFTTIPTNGNIKRDWLYLFTGISGANAVLDNVPNIKDPLLTSTRKTQILGEAKFLRALHYYNLVTTYGDVPLVLSLNSDLYPSRTPVAQVYAQIEKDLQDAEAALPVTTTDAGRATQGAAQALLAKVFAQEGNYQSSLTEANKVLPSKFGGTGSGGYDLLSNFEYLWDVAHKNSVESIFEIQHNSSNGFGDWGIELYLPYSLTGDTWVKFNEATSDMINTFRTEGDNIRLNSSIYFENTVASASTPPPYTNATQPVPFTNKWRITNGSTWNGNCNTILIRLADIILLKAEALNQTGQTAQAIPLVNAIRARVNLPAITVTSQADVATAILKERRLELAFEGQRWNDLLRYGVQYTINLINSKTKPQGTSEGITLTQQKMLFPVPQVERDLDKNLTQNPGY